MCYKKKDIIIIIIISIIFLIFYFFINKKDSLIENADFETASIQNSINNILTSNTFSNINISNSGTLKIGNTVLNEDKLKILNNLTQNHLDMLNGDTSLYIYKPNDWNKYLYEYNNGGIGTGNSTDSNVQKKRNGQWRISSNIPQNQSTCGGISDSCP